jgi:hypothetical protein
MTAPRRTKAAGIEPTASENSKTNPKPTGGRRELQGIATDRNACQPAPAWPRSAADDAADLLDELLRGARRGKGRI